MNVALICVLLSWKYNEEKAMGGCEVIIKDIYVQK